MWLSTSLKYKVLLCDGLFVYINATGTGVNRVPSVWLLIMALVMALLLKVAENFR